MRALISAKYDCIFGPN